VDEEVNMQESIELPEPVRLVGAREHDVLLELRRMMLLNPWSDVRLSEDVPVEPTLRVIVVGEAAIA
jgi:hypothetical protein